LLEDCLYQTVCTERSTKTGNFRLAEFKSRQHFEKVLLHPRRNYLSLPSLDSATELAGLFVNEGRPFSKISETNQTYIQQAMWIRNAIAHQSEFAIGIFRKKVPGVSGLVRNRQSPGPFLRDVFRVTPDQRRYEVYFTALGNAADELRSAWV